jgi:Glycosyl hydrolase catalytic core
VASLLAGCLAFQSTTSAAPAAEPSAGAIQPQFFGLHIFYPDRAQPWPDVGFGSWRLWDTAGLTWAELNPAPEVWKFDALDHAVARAGQQQLQLILTLGQTPQWASADPKRPSPRGWGSSAAPADLRTWERYVEAVATRYKGRIHAYEVWNEPRIEGIDRPGDAQFFHGTAGDLVAMSKAAYRIVKKIDPAALMLSPAFDGERLGERRLAAFLDAGGGCCFDVLSVHLYPHSSIEPESLWPRTLRLREQLLRAGLQRPIWNTEFGYLHEESGSAVRATQPNGFLSEVLPPARARAFLVRSFVLGAAAGLERFYWFAWDSSSMGLLTAAPDRVPGTTAAAYRTLSAWLVGGRVGDCRHSGARWECAYQGPMSCAGRFVWATDGGWNVSPPPTLSQALRIDGSMVRIAPGERLHVGAEPVLLNAGPPGPAPCPALDSAPRLLPTI